MKQQFRANKIYNLTLDLELKNLYHDETYLARNPVSLVCLCIASTSTYSRDIWSWRIAPSLNMLNFRHEKED